MDVGITGRILELLIDNPKITMAEMVERLNVAKRTIERKVKQLRETGRVERIGSKTIRTLENQRLNIVGSRHKISHALDPTTFSPNDPECVKEIL